MAEVLHIQFGLELTEAELECVSSVAEMTLDGSGWTFGEWLEINCEKEAALLSAYEKLDAQLKRFK